MCFSPFDTFFKCDHKQIISHVIKLLNFQATNINKYIIILYCTCIARRFSMAIRWKNAENKNIYTYTYLYGAL